MELAPPIVVPQKSEESKQIGPIDLAQILGDMLPSVGNRGVHHLSLLACLDLL